MDRVKHYLITGLLGFSFVSATHAGCLTDVNEWGIKPNIGIDAGMRHQPFSTDFGDDHFRQDYPVTNIYLGAKFHPYFGMEVGYEHMYRQDRVQFYNEFDPALGAAVPATDENRLFISDAYSQGWNVNLLGYWPICPRTKTELMGVIGIAWQKMYYSTAEIRDNVAAASLATWASDDRGMLRLGLGVRQMITKHFGARLQWLWEDTSKLGAAFPVPALQGGNVPPELISDNYNAKSKDNYSVMFGFFFQIT